MKCPHCNIEVNPSFREIYIGAANNEDWSIFSMTCPNIECKRIIIELASGDPRSIPNLGVVGLDKIKYKITVNPLVSSRPPTPNEVDEKFAADYKEACLTLKFSPKASAALSRRCLQNILREKAGVTPADLSKEIQQILDAGSLPSHLAESIDAIRQVGNFAAHPIKSKSTGEIVEVEPGEAEWTLDVIESVFDFYFVQPEKMKAKRDALNKKLTAAGKPPMK
ncbi:MAG TPA: DUF4145 domain-containing protein [Candidatus Cloacimonadota bacterium]|jgi:hypothetical protein|nr:DUF4145 domain-containing protein [Candidatus Cloacimonadota bacterium]